MYLLFMITIVQKRGCPRANKGIEKSKYDNEHSTHVTKLTNTFDEQYTTYEESDDVGFG